MEDLTESKESTKSFREMEAASRASCTPVLTWFLVIRFSVMFLVFINPSNLLPLSNALSFSFPPTTI